MEIAKDIEDVWVRRERLRRHLGVWVCMVYWKVYQSRFQIEI